MISTAQIRAARAMLGIDLNTLAKASGLGVETISRIESTEGTGLDNADRMALKQAFQALGVAFMAAGDCPDGGEGLRLTSREDAEPGIRPENLNATNDD